MTRTTARPIPAHELSAALRIRPGGWREKAECAAKIKREDEVMWLWDDQAPAGEDEHGRHARIAHAKAICNNECPVRVACLAAADPETERSVRGGWDLRDWDWRHRRGPLARAIAIARATVQAGAA